MFSQIDQKQIPIRKVMKSRASMDSLDSLDSLDSINVTRTGDGDSVRNGVVGSGEGNTEGATEDQAPPKIEPNPSMNSLVEELEKRFPSQSTNL